MSNGIDIIPPQGTRELILSKIKQNQPDLTPLPSLDGLKSSYPSPIEKFKEVLTIIGGQVIEVSDFEGIIGFLQEKIDTTLRLITTLPELSHIAETNWQTTDSHTLANVELAIIRGHIGVAENSAIWVTEDLLGQRVTPFIAQYLAIILNEKDIVPTMHHAYERIGASEYGFGTFIAGPSKTADIEQSLVLGAHGPRGLMVFLMKS
jgi:L-lactate dehydrogenase complex protein LldG